MEEKGLHAGGGGSLEPLFQTPPPHFRAHVTGTPGVLTGTPDKLPGELGGSPRYPNMIPHDVIIIMNHWGIFFEKLFKFENVDKKKVFGAALRRRW